MKKYLLCILTCILLICGNAPVEASGFESPICDLGAERLYENIKYNSGAKYKCHSLLKPLENIPLYGYLFDVSTTSSQINVSIGFNDAGYATVISIKGALLSSQAKADFDDFTNICLQTIGLTTDEISYIYRNLKKDSSWVHKELEKSFGKEDRYISSVYSISKGRTISFSISIRPSGKTIVFITSNGL